MSIIRAMSLAMDDHRELDYDRCYGDETMDNPFQNHNYDGDEEVDDNDSQASIPDSPFIPGRHPIYSFQSDLPSNTPSYILAAIHRETELFQALRAISN